MTAMNDADHRSRALGKNYPFRRTMLVAETLVGLAGLGGDGRSVLPMTWSSPNNRSRCSFLRC
jgi:hypothetical protein